MNKSLVFVPVDRLLPTNQSVIIKFPIIEQSSLQFATSKKTVLPKIKILMPEIFLHKQDVIFLCTLAQFS